MNIFVSGAAGFQGGNIAGQLLKNGQTVRTLKRSGGNLENMPGVIIEKGGFENIDALHNVLKDVDAAVYTFPLLFDLDLAKEYTINFITAAKEQKVPLIVFNTGFDLGKKNSEFLTLDIKTTIKELFDASGLNVITLVPDIYIDNISAPWSIPVILNNGIVPYPVAAGNKVPWISHVDLAKFVVAAIDKPILAGKVLPIGGNLFSGDEIATAISLEIGKEVNYVAMTPDEFEKQISPTFGELAGKEISNLYRYVDENREQLIAKNFQETQSLLGVIPQSLTDWVKSVQWEL